MDKMHAENCLESTLRIQPKLGGHEVSANMFISLLMREKR